ncbi:MAG: glycosyltransferase [Leptolyngbya sp. Prado105]|jgi:glycosyltransferase involved in cell wall biosynthesis|nr:glycosyltransferase [Leptolyngbya sp. Prado105]
MSRKIAIFLRDLDAGGTQKVSANLIREMVARGTVPDLVVSALKGPFLKEIPPEVRVINLNSKRLLFSFFKLSQYLRESQPDVLLSTAFSGNIAAILAKYLSRAKTRVLIATHNTLSVDKHNVPLHVRLPLLFLMRAVYPFADTIIAVSEGAARDLEIELSLNLGSVKTVYNPIVNSEMLRKAQEQNEHPWFQPGQPPVFLTIGRLFKQKNHRNLLQAFSEVRSQQASRLMILGEGDLREELECLVKELGLESDVWMPGFVDNPLSYLRQAQAFVLSSDYEALPTVLVEAMACGCPIVSTNCPYGPLEILENGKYGLLVPPNDPNALANAMQQIIKTPNDQCSLLNRARDFSVDLIVPQYLEMFGGFNPLVSRQS